MEKLIKPWKALCLCFFGSGCADPLFLTTLFSHTGDDDFRASTNPHILRQWQSPPLCFHAEPPAFYSNGVDTSAMKGLNCGRQKWLLSHIPTPIAADSVPKHFLDSRCVADVWNKEIEQSHPCCLATVGTGMMPGSVETLLHWSFILTNVFTCWASQHWSTFFILYVF